MDLIGFTHVALAVLVYCWQWHVSHQAICSNSPTPPTCLDDCNGRRFYLGQDGLCKMCVQCLEGMGLDKYCGDGENGDAMCIPCREDHYSDSSMYYNCLPCRICENTEVAQECTPTTDRQCGACHMGYYRDPQNPDLCNQRCEWLLDPKSEPQCSVWWESQRIQITQYLGRQTTSKAPISIRAGGDAKSRHLRSMILIAVVVIMLALVIVGIWVAGCMLRSVVRKKNTRQTGSGQVSPSANEPEEGEMCRLTELSETSSNENELPHRNWPVMTSQRDDVDFVDGDSTGNALDKSAEDIFLAGNAHNNDETDGATVAARCRSTHGKTEKGAVKAPPDLGGEMEAGDMGRDEIQRDRRVRSAVFSGDEEIKRRKNKGIPAEAPFHEERDLVDEEEEKGEEKREKEKNEEEKEKEEKDEEEEREEEKDKEEEKEEEEVATECVKLFQEDNICTENARAGEERASQRSTSSGGVNNGRANNSIDSEALNKILKGDTPVHIGVVVFDTVVLGDQHNYHEMQSTV